MNTQLKQDIFNEWRAKPIPTGDEQLFSNLLDVVFDPSVNYPVSVAGFDNALNLSEEEEVRKVVHMLFYLAGKDILNIELMHKPTAEIMEFSRHNIQEAKADEAMRDYTFVFTKMSLTC